MKSSAKLSSQPNLALHMMYT